MRVLKHCLQCWGMGPDPEAFRRTDRVMHEVALADAEAIPVVDLDGQDLDQ